MFGDILIVLIVRRRPDRPAMSSGDLRRATPAATIRDETRRPRRDTPAATICDDLRRATPAAPVCTLYKTNRRLLFIQFCYNIVHQYAKTLYRTLNENVENIDKIDFGMIGTECAKHRFGVFGFSDLLYKEITMVKLTTKYTTIATVGYAGSVSSKNENRDAHGAVCHLQARKGARGIIGRKVNSNGRHQEVGESFPLDADTLAHWERIAKSAK